MLVVGGGVWGGSAPIAKSAEGTKGAYHPLMPAWKVFTKPTSAATLVFNSCDLTKELHTFTENLSNILSQE